MARRWKAAGRKGREGEGVSRIMERARNVAERRGGGGWKGWRERGERLRGGKGTGPVVCWAWGTERRGERRSAGGLVGGAGRRVSPADH